MPRKKLIYAMLLGMLLLLNIGRIWFEADENAGVPDAGQDHIAGGSARFELVGLAEDEANIGTVARDIFAPVRPEVIAAVTRAAKSSRNRDTATHAAVSGRSCARAGAGRAG